METRSLSSASKLLPAESLRQEALPALRELKTIPMASVLSVLTGRSEGSDRVSTRPDTFGSPSDDTPSKEPPRPLMQEGGLPPRGHSSLT